jgi:lysophospholipase L1-like esterase
MTAISIADLENAKLDVDHIATVSTSLELTATDRLGHTKSTLSAAIDSIKSFNNRGAWTAVTVYAGKDLVSNAGTWYVCVVAHTSSAAFATDTASKWRVYQGITLADLSPAGASAMIGHSTGNTVKTELDILHRGDDPFNANGFSSVATNQCSFVLLGDSISEGVGATNYTLGCSWLAARSLLNAGDLGWPNDRTYGYHSIVNMGNALTSGLLSSTGSIVATGVVGSRVSLAAGQVLTLTGVSVDFADLVYDASASTGSVQVNLNGVLVATKTISGTGLQNTFPTQVSGLSGQNVLTAESDVITFTSVSGTVVITEVLAWRNSYISPAVHVIAKSGTAYQDYTSAGQMDEISYYLNLYRSSDANYLLLNLGTNNIYNATKSLTPSAMVAQISTLISGINSRCASVRCAIAVPPRAYETTWPVIAGGYTYFDYVDAIVAFAKANGHALVRHDKSILGQGLNAFYADGVHPNNTGHQIAARNICDLLEVPVNGNVKGSYGYISVPAEFIGQLSGSQANITMNSTWGPASGNSAYAAKARKVGKMVYLSGLIQANGSVAALIGTLPSGYFSPTKGVYTLIRDSTANRTLFIDTSGAMTIDAVAGTWLSLENVAISL